MSSNKSSEPKNYVTPPGILVFPNLNVPRDYKGNQQFAYDTGFDLEGQDALDFEATVKEIEEQALAHFKARKLASDIIVPALDDKKNEIPGTLRFRFKVAAEVQTKRGLWNKKPLFFKADGTPYEVEPMIGGGTRAQIAFEPYFWSQKAGVTLQPTIIRVLDLVEGRSRKATGYGDVNWGDAQPTRRAAAPVGADEDF